MGSRLRLVADSFSKFPSTVNTWEISHAAQRGTKTECDGHHVSRFAVRAPAHQGAFIKRFSNWMCSLIMNCG
jgi:hypothetical protein